MSDRWRVWLLWAGPPVLLYGSYVLSMRADPPARTPGPPSKIYLLSDTASPLVSTEHQGDARTPLEAACVHAAYEIQDRLDADFQTVVAIPYVIVGDLSAESIRSFHDEVIAPAAQSMQASYFTTEPTRPIFVVLTSTEKRFQEIAWAWDQRRPRGYYGYYLRDQRRMVVNMSTGTGSLTHELTHALSQADSPHLPEWFDEGLASLHEHCEMDERGRLVGLSNWRTRLLKDMVKRNGELPVPLEALLRDGIVRDADQQLRYATARTLCLWLQGEGKLAPLYRLLRQGDNGDDALVEVTGSKSLQGVTEQFLVWLKR